MKTKHFLAFIGLCCGLLQFPASADDTNTVTTPPPISSPNSSFNQAVVDYQNKKTVPNAEKVIRLAVAMTDLPPIPEEARKHFVRGSVFFKDATTTNDFRQASKEFGEAIYLAPWWPDARYNRALAFEAAGFYNLAITNLNLYLLFKLPAEEVRKVKDKIYALELKAEEVVNKKAEEEKAAAAAKQKKAEYQEKLGFLAGDWNYVETVACNCQFNGQTSQGRAVVTITGKNIQIARPPKRLIKGTIEGDDYASIQWTVKDNNDGLPECPIKITVNKESNQINWKEPSVHYGRSGAAWDWSMSANIQLTQ